MYSSCRNFRLKRDNVQELLRNRAYFPKDNLEDKARNKWLVELRTFCFEKNSDQCTTLQCAIYGAKTAYQGSIRLLARGAMFILGRSGITLPPGRAPMSTVKMNTDDNQVPPPADPRTGWTSFDEPPSELDAVSVQPPSAPLAVGPHHNASAFGSIFGREPSFDARRVLAAMVPVYYRLYCDSCPIDSYHPAMEEYEDKSLSEIFLDHVPPPRTVRNVVAYICRRERIHISRVTLFVTDECSPSKIRKTSNQEMLGFDVDDLCGMQPEDPLLIKVEVGVTADSKVDREGAVAPLPLWIQGSRTTGRGIVSFGKAFGRFAASAVRKKNASDDASSVQSGFPASAPPAQGKASGDMTSAAKVAREALPASYYPKYISDGSKNRKPNGIRGLYPLENLPGMISLLAGKPAPQTFPVTSLSLKVRSPFDPSQEQFLEIKGDALDESLQYSATKGIAGFQKWVYGLQERYHDRYDGEGWSVTVGTGSQDLLYKAFNAILNPGDPLFIEAPVYAGVLPILQALKCDLIEIPTDSQGIVTSAFRDLLKSWPEGRPRPKAYYTVPYGCNPSGITTSLERRREVLELAREYDFLILEDDPYFYLYYGQAARPPSYFRMEAQDNLPVGRVVRFDSLSKVLSSGLRLGFLSGPTPVVEAINLHTTAANLQVSSTSQAIAVAMLDYFGYDGFQKHTENVSEFYRTKRDVFEDAMRKHLVGLAEWSTPVSGMFMWFRLKLRPSPGAPEGDSAALIRERAVAKGVLALPGTSFSPNGTASPYVRAAFSLSEAHEVDEALRRLAEVIREYNGEQQ